MIIKIALSASDLRLIINAINYSKYALFCETDDTLSKINSLLEDANKSSSKQLELLYTVRDNNDRQSSE